MNKNKKILLLINNFPPEIGSAAQLFYELSIELSKKGYAVDVVTASPRPYRLAFHSGNKEKYKLIGIEYLTVDGSSRKIRVLKLLPIGYFNVKILLIIEHILQPLIFFLGSIFLGRHDFVVVYSPPFFLNIVGIILKKLWNAKLILNVQDPYPETAVKLKPVSYTHLTLPTN